MMQGLKLTRKPLENNPGCIDWPKELHNAEKMLSMLVPGTNIFDSINRLNYTEYWKNEHALLQGHLDKLDIEDAMEQGRHLKFISYISQNISEYINKLSEMLHLPMEELKANYYGPLIEKINKFESRNGTSFPIMK
ncbi:MAG: hypothetical protein EOO45_02815 [Flavobacterium sp.]|nr:MAG: hypothetical protein EOO45_02815 [Flavobacterium sp.]